MYVCEVCQDLLGQLQILSMLFHYMNCLKSYSNHIMKKNFLSINISKLPFCTTEQGIEIIKKNIKSLKDWKEISVLIPQKFKETKMLKKSGLAGLFSASLELAKRRINKYHAKKKILIDY